eukprot:6228927-Alexandrium_andersonii.AAC.1
MSVWVWSERYRWVQCRGRGSSVVWVWRRVARLMRYMRIWWWGPGSVAQGTGGRLLISWAMAWS